ncbi:HD-GYP domain-containing protein [Methylobacterium sp. J-076]|uniref:HD-GYP domain-containing protein n=1 Tax=Methylobacterium sp. J-076 TaxID=2836655 RepID=UPI001FB9BB59|nr:HD domain-containing phosphohydrolase [Methylobacterium sp. J-076]MCJ2015640.1 HD domain-containing protein [Methylobacterium sp. J-076]
MASVLILTDDPESGNRLARNLGGGAVVCDLYDDLPAPTGRRLVIADIRSPHSESIARLKHALVAARGAATPFLYLFHGSRERGEMHATMLGATKSLPAMTAAALLAGAVADLTGAAPAVEPDSPAKHAQAARRAFAAIFTGEAPATELVDDAAEIVNRAARDMKVQDWLNLVAAFDDITHRHCLTVAGLAAAFAATLHFNPADAHFLTKGALLHDIGKSKIPRAILDKPGPLTVPERQVMNQHPLIGYTMLEGRGFSDLALKVVRSHHELLDGAGYPDGLRGPEIPDVVRLVTICDIFAALIERRPYKAPLSAPDAYGIMLKMVGKLDPDLLRAFAPVAFASDTETMPLSA